MHYPLLAYWGKQFGIMPPDVIASKLFDLICCIANVGASRSTQVPGSPTSVGQLLPKGQPIPLGRMMVFTGTHQEVTASLESANVSPARTVHLNPLDFIARVTRATQGGDASASQPLVRASVAGVPGLTVVMPDDETAAPTSPANAAPTTTAPSTRPAPLTEIVRTASSRTGKAAVPLLLRGLAESIASRIADAVPLGAETPAEQAVTKRLSDAGITSVARLLNQDPETIYNTVLQKESAAELGSVLDRAAKLAQALAEKVCDALASYAQEHGLASRDGFSDPRVAGDFAKVLGALLKKSKLTAPPDEVVAAAVASATSAA
jgi:hypothetical protein